jgi:dynein heavy chain
MRAICLLLYPSPTEKMKDASGLRFVTDWWAASIKLLNKPGLLSDLLIFDKDNVDEKIIKNLGAFLTDPEFKDTLEVNVVANASEACRCMIMWV